MKLITRTSLLYVTLSLIAFTVSGVISYNLLQTIFRNQLDVTLNEERLLVEQTINFSDSVPDFRLVFGHMIDVTILNSPRHKAGYVKDTLMYDQDLGAFASFRHLCTENTSYRNKGYIINIYKPLADGEKLLTDIILYLTLVFLSLMLMLVLVNYFITRRVWVPFYHLLQNLGKYEIHQAKPLELVQSDIYEFKMLNQALDKMSRKIRLDYMNLKEFNENAAHELQTPLAIIKSKLELLVQGENLDEKQLKLISSLFEATNRMSRLNQGLLLISKIENNQFPQTEKIDLGQLIDKTLDHFGEMIDHRRIALSRNYTFHPTLRMNPVLAEILINNLVSNAIRHNIQEGRIDIRLEMNILTITNTGNKLHINPNELFQRFRKPEGQTESLGLGLAIVQKIAHFYAIRIEYQYQEGLHKLVLLFNN